MAPYLNACKFNNCTHVHEPGCAVKKALEAGRIDQNRYDSYIRIVQSLN
jgi:ribosome biogenesis GTPase